MPEFTLPRDEIVTEYAQEYAGGAMLVHPGFEGVDLVPLAEWIEIKRRFGGHVHRRKIIVVEDWTEVDEP